MNVRIKQHWETIYQTKQPNEVSWTEEKPSVSLDLIHSFNPSKSAKIIDIGGGDSKLVDYLLAEGYTDISVLDISEAAIERAKKRLGKKSNQITWIITCRSIIGIVPALNILHVLYNCKQSITYDLR